MIGRADLRAHLASRLARFPRANLLARWTDGRNMKTLKSLVLAGISSLLLAAGFARAAEKFDPLSARSAGVLSGQHLTCASGSSGAVDNFLVLMRTLSEIGNGRRL